MRRSIIGWTTAAVLLVSIGFGALALVMNRSTFHPPAWVGPAAFIRHEGGDRLCLPLRQEETRTVFDYRSSRFPTLRSRAFHHFSIRCHDPVTARPLATHPLAIIPDLDGGREAQLRVIGQEREFLWLFLRDEALAIRVTDGRLAASRALLERQFPRLRDRLPAEPRGYGFDAGLVFMTADAEPLRLTLAGMSLGPYDAPPDRSAIGRDSQWHGRFRTREFLTRRAVAADRWHGLYTEREAADAANDAFGDKFRSDAAVLDEGAATRRRWWRAEAGRTREFSEGSHPRLTALRPAGDGQAHLAGGLMKRGGGPRRSRSKGRPAGCSCTAPGSTRRDACWRPGWTATSPRCGRRRCRSPNSPTAGSFRAGSSFWARRRRRQAAAGSMPISSPSISRRAA